MAQWILPLNTPLGKTYVGNCFAISQLKIYRVGAYNYQSLLTLLVASKRTYSHRLQTYIKFYHASYFI